MTHQVSESELRERLGATLGDDQAEELLDQYLEARSLVKPNMELITHLAQRSEQTALYRVSFRLLQEQYDALATYYGVTGSQGTILVQKAVEEFISILG